MSPVHYSSAPEDMGGTWECPVKTWQAANASSSEKEGACVFSAVATPPLPSYAFLAACWEGGKRNLGCAIWFPSSYPTFLSANDSIFCLYCSSGFPSQLHDELDKSLQFFSCACCSEQQPATPRVSFSFAKQQLRKTRTQEYIHLSHVWKVVCCCFCYIIYLFLISAPRVRNLSDKNKFYLPKKNIPLAFPEAKQSKFLWRTGEGNMKNYL